MIDIRPATHDDLQAMANVINPIIKIGGTTAFETPLTAARIGDLTLDRTGIVSVFVALDADGEVGGFQYLTCMPDLDPSIGEIASFARLKGAGRAMMARTIQAAQDAGLRAINATIRADNVQGLGFYTAMGFQDHDLIKDVPLKDGTPVDRVVKRLTL